MSGDAASCGPWVQTFSGAAIDILNPDPATIRLVDIAASLSALPRFNGHTTRPWSVADHSLLAESLCPIEVGPEARLFVLLHDAHEMVTGEIVTPMKIALSEASGFSKLDTIQNRLQWIIHEAAGLGSVARYRDVVKTADLMALAIEKQELLGPCDREWEIDFPEVVLARFATEIRTQEHPMDAFMRRWVTLARDGCVKPLASFLAWPTRIEMAIDTKWESPK